MIFTDSLSSIQAIQNGYTSNSVCRRLQHEMHDVLLTNIVELCWIPSHVGVLGNEEADLTAEPLNLYEFSTLTGILSYNADSRKIDERLAREAGKALRLM